MNILIIGNGGREHAIAWALQKSPKLGKIYFSGHSGVASDNILNANLNISNFEIIDKFIKENDISLVVVGPENPLNDGVVDFLKGRGHKVLGPEKKSALLEGSKSFSKKFMQKYEIPTADYEEVSDYETAISKCELFGFPTVIKADGLCAGKGVYICQNKSEVENALKEIFIDQVFAQEGSKVVIEKFLQGFEASLLCFVSGNKIYPFDTAMDYKKIYENDLGPNTGGVGCISPNPYWNDDFNVQSQSILKKIEKGFECENLGYSGILFIGYLVDNGKVYVLEFNTRFGDPETEVLLPRLKSDLLENILQSVNLEEVKLEFEKNYSMTTILVSNGYPKTFEKGYEIIGLNNLDSNIIVFHNGTKIEDGKILSNGGRVLSVVSVSDSLENARKNVYKNIEKINFENMSFRTDIGNIKF